MLSSPINKIDIVSQNNPNKLDIYENTIKEMLTRKQDINNQNKKNTHIKNNHEELISVQNETKILDLQKSYNQSLILLEKIKEQVENKILKKYNIEKKHTQNIYNVSQDTNHISLKKKFLITPIKII